MQSVRLRRREPVLGVIDPVLDLESTYALAVFIEYLVEGPLAFPQRLAGICDSIRLIAFHWAKVEQKSRTASTRKFYGGAINQVSACIYRHALAG